MELVVGVGTEEADELEAGDVEATADRVVAPLAETTVSVTVLFEFPVPISSATIAPAIAPATIGRVMMIRRICVDSPKTLVANSSQQRTIRAA